MTGNDPPPPPFRLEFTLKGAGQGEREVDTTDLLVAPLRKSLEDEVPASDRTTLVILDQDRNRETVLGTFLQTAAGRILFFFTLPMLVSVPKGLRGRVVDHLTLEPPTPSGKRRTHFTLRGTKRKFGARTRIENPDLAFPWFTLLLPNLGHLPDLPSKLSIRFGPLRDKPGRFADRVIHARPSFSRIAISIPEGHFLQLDVWAAGGTDWRRLPGTHHLATGYAEDWLPEGSRTVRFHTVALELTRESGLGLVLSTPKGALAGEPVFAFPRVPSTGSLKQLRRIYFDPTALEEAGQT